MEVSESEAVVARVEGDYAWVEVRKGSACGKCDSEGSCGSGLLAEALGPKYYRVPNAAKARVGDVVVISAAAGSLAKAALFSYLGPLALAIAGALAGNALAGDLGAVGGVCLGLAVGVAFLRGANRWFAAAPEPMLDVRIKRHVISLPKDAIR